jgi:phage gp46-like protein
MSQDIKLFQDGNNNWDIDFENGDFALTKGLDTAIYMSLFCEKRADANEVPNPILRRGHFTNEFSRIENYEVGSKLWLYIEQARNTDQNISLIEDSIKDGLKWLIDQDIIKDINLETSFIGSNLEVNLDIIGKSQEDTENYNLLINTN